MTLLEKEAIARRLTVALGREKGWVAAGFLLQHTVCLCRELARQGRLSTTGYNGSEGCSRNTECSQEKLWEEHVEGSGRHARTKLEESGNVQIRSSKAKVPVGFETVMEGDGGRFGVGSGKLREEGVELKRSRLRSETHCEQSGLAFGKIPRRQSRCFPAAERVEGKQIII